MSSRVLRGGKEGDFKSSQREEGGGTSRVLREEGGGLQGFSEGGRRGTSRVLRGRKEGVFKGSQRGEGGGTSRVLRGRKEGGLQEF